MTKIEPNELQKLYRRTMTELGEINDELLLAIRTRMVEGNTIDASITLSFKETRYGARQRGIISQACANACALPFAATQTELDMNRVKHWFLYKDWGQGVKLSESLHTSEMRAEIRSILSDYMKIKKDIYDYAKVLKSVDSFDKVPREIRALIGELRRTGAITQQTLTSVNAYIDGLSRRGGSKLAEGYSRAVDRAIAGESVARVVDTAVRAKVDYVQQRIMRTEFARAYDVGFTSKIADDDDVIGFRSVLSSGHPVVDICDHYATVNAYGMGAGVVPKSALCRIPYHPNCLCLKEEVYRGEVKTGRYSQERVEQSVKSRPEAEQKLIVGAKAVRNGDILGGLKRAGYAPNEPALKHVLPKDCYI